MAQVLDRQGRVLQSNGPGPGLSRKGREATYVSTAVRIPDLTADLCQGLALNRTRGAAVAAGLVNEDTIVTGRADPTITIGATGPTRIIVVITITIEEEVGRVSKTAIGTTTTIRISVTIIEEASNMDTITTTRTIVVVVRIEADDSSIITGRASAIFEITDGISATDVPTLVIGTATEACLRVR